MTYIILAALGIASVLLARSSWNQKKQVLFVLTFILGGSFLFIMIDLLMNADVTTKGPPFRRVAWSDLALYFTMLAGMSLKPIYDALGRNRRFKLNKQLLIRPIIVSPIAFLTVYASLSNEPLNVFLLIFAFQNGFFWQTLTGREKM